MHQKSAEELRKRHRNCAAIQFGYSEKFLSPFGSKLDQRDGWASTRVLLEGDDQVLELKTQQGTSPVLQYRQISVIMHYSIRSGAS